MAAAGCVRSEDQFLCSICVEVFTDPVTIPCGHNFCKSCISEHWGVNVPYQCPMCKEVFNTKPQLKINTFISEMVAQFRHEAEHEAEHEPNISSSDQQAAKPGEVPCDICSQTKLKALKSCLVCLTSYCRTHLEPHLKLSGLKLHQLIHPVENLEDRMCKKHDKPLELFCKTDHTCICVFCPVVDHKNHEFVPLKDEHEEQKPDLKKTEVHYGDERKNLPDKPQRFCHGLCVVAKQSFSSGRFYFEVQVKGKTDWTLGVVSESINRKEGILPRPRFGYWTICLINGNLYIAAADPCVCLSVKSDLQKVGVFVDYEEGLVSFYDVDSSVLFYSFTGCCFSDKLLPIFDPGRSANPNAGGLNSAPLIITPVTH
uniref:Uncharacterized protein n=1 Tax=Sphaeramia orbicularis TaxID=375764 RepID=A0A672YQ22_9TELE